jgi:hypothetical protein
MNPDHRLRTDRDQSGRFAPANTLSLPYRFPPGWLQTRGEKETDA